MSPERARADQLVARASAALRRAAHAPQVTDLARSLANELEDAWSDEPLVVGVRGDVESRTQLLAVVLGEPLDPQRGARTPIRVTRGDTAALRATRSDGTVEELAKPAETTRAPTVETPAAAQVERAVAVERAAAALPRRVRERPPWWAVWAWIARWILQLVHRDKIRALAVLVAARDHAQVELDRAVGERVDVLARNAMTFGAYGQRLLQLASSPFVTELVVEVAAGPLTPEVDVIEILDGGDLTAFDLVVSVKQRVVFAIDLHDERVRRLGPVDEAPAEFVHHARIGRARRLCWRAIEVLRSVEATLGEIVASADARFRSRISELEALHVDDRAAFTTSELARLRPEIIARASAIVKHVLAHVGAELDRIDAAWTDSITEAKTAEELQAAVARVDQASPAQVQEVVVEARRLLAMMLGGCVHDLGGEAAGALARAHGMPADRLRDLGSAPPAVTPILAKLADAQGSALGAVGGGWLTGLFKSFDARRSEALAKLRQRVIHLRELASAELLDVEPRLYAALGESLEALLGVAIERHGAWLTERIAAEQAAVAGEREALAPLARARDAAHDDARALAAAIASLT